jgi:hypothetical protein
MRLRRAFPLLLSALALGVGAGPLAGCDPVRAAPGGLAWSPPSAGLRVALDLPAGPHRAGTQVTVGLRFRNVGKTPLRVYLLAPEAFRASQSTFLVLRPGPGGSLVSIQPPPRPHGYLPRESDFPALAPGKTLAATQTLSLADPAFRSGGRFVLAWTYENAVTRLAGGARTLDGVTRPLFGGGPIPGIWTGKLRVEATLDVQAR